VAALESRRDREMGQAESAAAGATGLLARMEALHSLGGSSSTLGLAQWVLRLFIVVIDALPVLVKFLMSLMPPTPYDRALERVEADLDEREGDAAEIEREISRLRAEVPLIEARSQHRLEIDMADDNVARKVAAQGRIYDFLIERWEEQQREAIEADPAAYVS
jgi:hypothetical protein